MKNKTKKSRKKIKEIKLPMKFNPGTMTYEPVLPKGAKEKMQKEDKEKILKAGQIVKQVRDWSKGWIKPGMLLVEIAEKIESKILELGAKPAFPAGLCINEMTAHYTPEHGSKEVASGLLKVDFGAHIDGWTADNAFSIDLEENEENKKLISASEKALNNAIDFIKSNFKGNVSTNQIGSVISEAILPFGFSPVVNLAGHNMEQYVLHAGITIPNIPSQKGTVIQPGLYAIEPFVSNGNGHVKGKKGSGIYELKSEKKPRSPFSREILDFIISEYNTLPFCSRWIVKKFGMRALAALQDLENNGNLHHFEQLVETSKTDVPAKVSQSEHTILIEPDGNIVVTTL